MKVSVIVPIYKIEDFLPLCLDSVLKQTYRDFELLLVDDGSPDGCGAICDAYARHDSRIRVFHREHQGVAAARNLGIAQSKGEYVLFVDGDDAIQPELLQKVMAGVGEYSADMVIFHHQAVDIRGKLYYSASVDLPVRAPFTLEECPKLLLSPASLCNKLIRKDLFQNVFFPPGMWYEDLWMLPRLYRRAKRIVYLGKEPLYSYRMRPGSIMHSGELDKLYQDRTAALSELFSYFRSAGIFEQYQEELEALTILHGYFYASLEILQVGKRREQLARFREFLEKRFPNFKHNKYIKTLSATEQIKFKLLNNKQYMAIRFLSNMKNLTRKCRK